MQSDRSSIALARKHPLLRQILVEHTAVSFGEWKASYEARTTRYIHQLTIGCDDVECDNPYCASGALAYHVRFLQSTGGLRKQMKSSAARPFASVLAIENAQLCYIPELSTRTPVYDRIHTSKQPCSSLILSPQDPLASKVAFLNAAKSTGFLGSDALSLFSGMNVHNSYCDSFSSKMDLKGSMKSMSILTRPFTAAVRAKQDAHYVVSTLNNEILEVLCAITLSSDVTLISNTMISVFSRYKELSMLFIGEDITRWNWFWRWLCQYHGAEIMRSIEHSIREAKCDIQCTSSQFARLLINSLSIFIGGKVERAIGKNVIKEITLALSPSQGLERLLEVLGDDLLNLSMERRRGIIRLCRRLIDETTGMETGRFSLFEVSAGALRWLKLLYIANQESKTPVDVDVFRSPILSFRVLSAPREFWESWHTPRANTVHILDFPFIFNMPTKNALLHERNFFLMMDAYEQSCTVSATITQSFRMNHKLGTRLTTILGKQMQAYIWLSIRHDHLLEDAFSQLAFRHRSELLSPMRVKYHEEMAVDQGGVIKDFFGNVMKGLLRPEWGMFEEDDESHRVWFRMGSGVERKYYVLAGLIIGLAMYQGIVVSLQFPKMIWKRLLGLNVEFEDLVELHPTLAAGLQMLLQWDDGDVEDVFLRTYEFSYEFAGKVVSTSLGKNPNMAVTNANRHSYVQDYVRWVSYTAVREQIEAFEEGFFTIMDKKSISLFTPDEMLVVAEGTDEIDIMELQKIVKYEDGFSLDHPLIQHFWSIVMRYDFEEKQRLLRFITASNRLPVNGLDGMSIIIQRNGTSQDRLPTSYTCFSRLLLPEYDSNEKLEKYLALAMENVDGFGLA
ncbi:Ubiquitin-protein ligase E3A [Neolecta irregularis DAH-3]|uniref:HECT-type E3 ubiquitin transferase n=1 Tax=Neolecta irregularis (strain DAH-3) TaxID=1198029 RepID=A0A1U7LP90_NEOID|nr:Ubiquitin-protein ligase E3A [Neolecta irregularis DAH-3]|eukprot:OLL24362.1 Ubiquitin-protein ligase E3A [Neolecta irregularis DAH-3]